MQDEDDSPINQYPHLTKEEIEGIRILTEVYVKTPKDLRKQVMGQVIRQRLEKSKEKEVLALGGDESQRQSTDEFTSQQIDDVIKAACTQKTKRE